MDVLIRFKDKTETVSIAKVRMIPMKSHFALRVYTQVEVSILEIFGEFYVREPEFAYTFIIDGKEYCLDSDYNLNLVYHLIDTELTLEHI